MQKFHIKIITFLMAIIVCGATCSEAYGAIKAGESSVKVGETTTVYLASAYANTLAGATGVSARWSTSSSDFSIQSQANTWCTIKGNRANGSATLNFYASYYINGFYRTMDFYYEISVKDNVVHVTSVTVSPTTKAMTVGDTYPLTASVYPSNASNRSVYWQSNNTSVASVSTSGVVTAKGSGTTRIYATSYDDDSKYGYCDVTVTSPAPTGVKVTVDKSTITAGESVTATATVSGANEIVTWSCSGSYKSANSVQNKYYVYTDENAEGTIKITAKTSNGYSATATVTVQKKPTPNTIALSLDEISMMVGDTETIKATITGDNASTCTWTSSNSSVATETGSGTTVTINGVAPGTATITAKAYDGTTAICKVNIINETDDTALLELYVVGDMTNWEFLDDFKMETHKLGDYNSYYLDLDYFNGKFLIATKDYKTVFGGNVTIEEKYHKKTTVEKGNHTHLQLEFPLFSSRIELYDNFESDDYIQLSHQLMHSIGKYVYDVLFVTAGPDEKNPGAISILVIEGKRVPFKVWNYKGWSADYFMMTDDVIEALLFDEDTNTFVTPPIYNNTEIAVCYKKLEESGRPELENPSKIKMTISGAILSNVPGNTTITVATADGKIIMNRTTRFDEDDVELTLEKNGVYLIELSTGETYKIIK